jgi:hypothetical protein
MSVFLLSDHAVERFAERHGDAAELEQTELRHALLAELERSTIFGGQIGKDQLRLLPCGLVAVTRADGDTLLVKTVLTKKLAIANMEAQGLTLTSYGVAVLAPLRPLLWKRTDMSLQGLAEYHFRLGTGKKARNRDLREHGFDPAGPDGHRYRTLLEELRQAANANGTRPHDSS